MFRREETEEGIYLREAQVKTTLADKSILVNGLKKGSKKGEPELHPVGFVGKLPDGKAVQALSVQSSSSRRFKKAKLFCGRKRRWKNRRE